MESAKDILLDLEIPDDDPLKKAKQMVSNCAPGVRIIDADRALRWEGEYIWLICVNEEDGLEFEVAQTNDGARELKVAWKDTNLSDTSELKGLLRKEPLWDVYQLRAVSIIQERVEQQLQILDPERPLGDELGAGTEIREESRALSAKLRNLEWEMLNRFYEHLEQEVSRASLHGVILVH